MRIAVLILILLLSSIFSRGLFGQVQKWKTENLILLNPSPAHNFILPYMTQCFENALRYHKKFFHYTPGEPVTVFMQDFWDYGNAGATAIPKNYIRIGIAPLSYTYETSPANERINHTMNHELVHVVAGDKASANDLFFRKLFFGKVAVSAEDPLSMLYSYLTNPRRYAPRWYHEGIAVFMETWMAGGIGRAMGSYDEMVFRTMVSDSSYFYSVIGLVSEGTAIDFQIGVNSYLYGTRFISYLAYQYGPEKLIAWVSDTKNRKKYFSSDFERIYGSSLDEEWQRWIRWEHQFQKDNLAAIRRFPVTAFRPIAHQGLGSVSRGYYDKTSGKIYLAVLYPAHTPHIVSIDVRSGTMEEICEIVGAGLYYVTSLAFDPENRILFYTTDNHAWRDLNLVELTSGKTRMLIKDARTGDLAFNRKDGSLWGIRHYNGISTIVRISKPYTEWNQIYSWPYGKDMYDIDISPDGKFLSGALASISGRQLLIKMSVDSLLKGKAGFDTLFDFETSLPANFTFSPDGRYLFGSSYYSGVSNIYRYDLERDDIVALSNCQSGFFRPVPFSEDSLIVFRYTGQGFLPGIIPNKPVERVSAIRFLGNEIVTKYPQVKRWIAPPPSRIRIDSLHIEKSPYNSLANLQLNSVYPIVEGYKNTASVGLRMDLMDWLGAAGLSAKISYTPSYRLPAEERLHARLKFRYWDWELRAAYNPADFYDLFGPTKTGRKGYVLGLRFDRSVIYEKPRLLDFNANVTGYAGLDRLPFFQNVTVPVDRFLTFGASLKYRFLLKTLGAVENEKGFEAEVISYNYYANSQFFPHLLLNVHYGFLLPIPHSSLWIRSSLGVSGGQRDVAFSNYYFGGFGNNRIDHQNSQRYREFYSFPGTALNSIEAQNYVKLLFEWNLPPLRFRRFGFTNLYLNWARLSLFTSGLAEDIFKKKYSGTMANIGAQLDFKIVIFTYMSSTFSVGYGAALSEGGRRSDEFMISLKIL
ncbi:MAG TPA: hypothetical protein ENK44_12780 [Caldithrix abyssi]|uniref:Uncharacterized protein n=1 Tax=Caldithrix abyssi TaxID=187145 RepID=A0A7V4U1Y0_CALAY|nr:hypothetical protein [Caldithrix abyssi]